MQLDVFRQCINDFNTKELVFLSHLRCSSSQMLYMYYWADFYQFRKYLASPRGVDLKPHFYRLPRLRVSDSNRFIDTFD